MLLYNVLCAFKMQSSSTHAINRDRQHYDLPQEQVGISAFNSHLQYLSQLEAQVVSCQTGQDEQTHSKNAQGSHHSNPQKPGEDLQNS